MARIRGPRVGDALLREGRVALEDGALVYGAAFDGPGGETRLVGRRASDRGAPLGERLRSLRRLHVELGPPGAAPPPEASVLEAEGANPIPCPLVTNAPSTWQRLKAAAAFERIVAGELLGGSSAVP